MSRRGWLLFILLGVLWGMPYLLIRIAVGTIDPLVVAGSRTFIGALLLLPVALHRNALGAAFRNWKWLLAFTLIEISIPWVLLGHAETRLNSSTAGLLIAIPTLLVAAYFNNKIDKFMRETDELLMDVIPCFARMEGQTNDRASEPRAPEPLVASGKA